MQFKGEPNRFYIVSDNVFLAQRWAQEMGFQARHVLAAKHLRGVRNVTVFLIGDYAKHPKWSEIHAELEYMELTGSVEVFTDEGDNFFGKERACAW